MIVFDAADDYIKLNCVMDKYFGSTASCCILDFYSKCGCRGHLFNSQIVIFNRKGCENAQEAINVAINEKVQLLYI